MSNELAKLEKATQMLAAASNLEECKEIHDIAKAAVTYAKAAKLGLKDENHAKSIQLLAAHKSGGFLRQLNKHVGGDRKSITSVGNRSDYQGALTDANITYQDATRFVNLSEVPEDALKGYIEEKNTNEEQITFAGATTLAETMKSEKKKKRKKNIQQQREAIDNGTAQLPTGLFEVISIDPPWPYGTEYDASGRRAANPYPEMSLEQIKNIEIPASFDCVLWLWTTHKFMRHSFEILDYWGFRDVAIVTWVKDRMGLGDWLRSQSEFCIMAVKGKPIIDLTNQTTILNGKMREHSRKPEEFYAMVDSLCIGRKLDYFSREPRSGWSQYGNDLERFS